MRQISRLLFAGVVCAATVQSAFGGAPPGTAFTYQGQLKEAGNPIDGTYDLTFALFDVPTDGEPIAQVVSIGDWPVSNGLFTVEVDFGDGVFTGQARWLEVAVRPGDSESEYTVLTPRQPMTPTPYALHALSGSGGGGFWAANGNDIHNTNSGRVGIGTSSPNFTLEVYDSGGPNSPPAKFGVHWVQPALPQSLHDWFYFAVGGSALSVGSGTRLIRESGTQLHFQTRDEMHSGLPSTQMVLDADGKVGIGTLTPSSLLHLSSLGGIDLIVDADTNNSGEDQNARMVLKQDGRQVVGRVGYRNGLNKLEIMQEFGDSLILGTSNMDRITITGDGKVGIGTADIPAGVMLAVDGKALFEEVEVQLSQDWPDYVFDDDYELMPLKELAAIVRKSKHLPGIPSAQEVEEKGVSLGRMQTDLLRSVEELTLYMIELNQHLDDLKRDNSSLRKRVAQLEESENNVARHATGEPTQCTR